MTTGKQVFATSFLLVFAGVLVVLSGLFARGLEREYGAGLNWAMHVMPEDASRGPCFPGEDCKRPCAAGDACRTTTLTRIVDKWSSKVLSMKLRPFMKRRVRRVQIIWWRT